MPWIKEMLWRCQFQSVICLSLVLVGASKFALTAVYYIFMFHVLPIIAVLSSTIYMIVHLYRWTMIVQLTTGEPWLYTCTGELWLYSSLQVNHDCTAHYRWKWRRLRTVAACVVWCGTFDWGSNAAVERTHWAGISRPPVPSVHLYVEYTYRLSTPIGWVHLYVEYTCRLSTPVCWVHLMLSTPVGWVHLYVEYTCMLSWCFCQHCFTLQY